MNQTRGVIIGLDWLDLIFLILALISLGFNLYQFLRDRYKYQPLKNSLIALFNDLKSKQSRYRQRLRAISHSTNQDISALTVKAEFSDFIEESTRSLDQLREHVVGAIHTLDPSISDQSIFRASEFGLTDVEKATRKDMAERLSSMAQARLAQRSQGAEQRMATETVEERD